MKILVCIYEYPPYYSSGAGNVAYYLVNQLKKMGINCTVCSPIGGDVELCNRTWIEKTHNYGILDHLYRVLYFWHKAGKYVKENHSEYDVVWLQNPSPISFRIRLQKSLLTIHTTYYGYSLLEYPLLAHTYHKIMAKFEKQSYSSLGAMFSGVSQQVCHELEKIGVERERITYIPNGVDTGRFKPSANRKELRKKFNLPEDGLILLSLGTLREPKQPYKLIEVFSLIEKSIKDVQLVIGGDGELLEKTKRLAEKKGLTRVRFLGYVDHDKDVPDLYAGSDYYIMTSKYEGQPLTLLEAMASGLPCIVSNISALRIVEEAKCGIVVDFNSVETAASQIIEYLGGDNTNHSRNAREYAVSNLDWEIIAKKYLEEFRGVGFSLQKNKKHCSNVDIENRQKA